MYFVFKKVYNKILTNGCLTNVPHECRRIGMIIEIDNVFVNDNIIDHEPIKCSICKKSSYFFIVVKSSLGVAGQILLKLHLPLAQYRYVHASEEICLNFHFSWFYNVLVL